MMIKKYQAKLNKNGEVYLRIKARPNSSRTKIIEVLEDDTIKIDLRAEPKKGKANQELIKYLAKEFKISKENVIIISGQREKLKLLKLINNLNDK